MSKKHMFLCSLSKPFENIRNLAFSVVLRGFKKRSLGDNRLKYPQMLPEQELSETEKFANYQNSTILLQKNHKCVCLQTFL